MRKIALVVGLIAAPALAQDDAPDEVDVYYCAGTAWMLEQAYGALRDDGSGFPDRASRYMRLHRALFPMIGGIDSNCEITQQEAGERTRLAAEERNADFNRMLGEGMELEDIFAALRDDIDQCRQQVTAERLDGLRVAILDGDVPCGWTLQ